MKYIVYHIENVQPIKQASTIMQKDNEFTKSYISGANMRGAFIANYMNIKGIKDIKGIHKEKLLKGGLTFLNAYPAVDGNRSLPMPKCYFALKDNIKTFSFNNRLKIYSSLKDLDEEKEYEKVKGFDFAQWDLDKDNLNVINVGKSSNIHIKNEEKNKIFRYESINSGNEFVGIIMCDDDNYAEECKEILEKGLFYIGGSKGSGYGLCRFNKVKINDINPEIKYLKELLPYEDSGDIVIVALSDILYRQENGIYSAYLEEKLLKKELGLRSAKLKESFVENEYITGYNNKWGYRLPNIKGIKAGSVFVYETEGEIDEKLLYEFIEKGVGERKSEGYGRIAILSSLPFNYIYKYKKSDDFESDNKIELSCLEKKDLRKIVNRIYREKLDNRISQIVLKLSDDMRNEKAISSNQWGKLFNLMKIVEPLDYNDGIEKIQEYFKNINEKKNNRYLKNSLEKIQINNINLEQYIINQVKELDSKKFSWEFANEISIGDVNSCISNQEIYQYKVKVLKEIFRLKSGNSGKGGM